MSTQIGNISIKSPPEGYREVSLGELFDDDAIEQLTKILKSKDDKALKDFLVARGYELRRKGVVPEYLYYWLKNYYASNLEKVI